MKDIIFDNSQSLNIKLTKNKFLKACSSMSAYMPEARISFIKIFQQCFNNVIFSMEDIVSTCFLQSSQETDTLLTIVVIIYLYSGHGLFLFIALVSRRITLSFY